MEGHGRVFVQAKSRYFSPMVDEHRSTGVAEDLVGCFLSVIQD